ncbi:MAG TPA: 16S rRNA (guanine(966)-N(2))-methyltransferase RsmD, partial [Burkholderiales bacterium]|nr:16S rRNA (guanine(966)-N(2))-methyltransferase RsmD [Burkholderiales bacterium]
MDNRVRIVGGDWRSRLIRFPGKFDIRPTPDRVRETVFNWLGQTLHGKTCLDLFAGSGAMGFEALSRGAEKVTMVENNREVARSIAENAKALGCDRLDLVCRDAIEFLDSESGVYDVIFLDPPFGRNYLPLIWPKLVRHVAGNGRVYIEAETLPEIPRDWTLMKSGKAGKVN